MTFFSPEAALDWLRGKLRDFYGQGTVLKDQLIQIGHLIQKAKAANNQPALGQLIVQRAQVEQLLTEQFALEQKVYPIAEFVGVSPGLGLLPALVAALAIPLAATIYIHFQKVANQKKSLDLIAKGLLTPEEAKALATQPILGAGFGAALTMPLVLGGLVLAVLFLRR